MPESSTALDQILDAASQLIVDHGYATLTMTALAQAAGLPLATLYRIAPDRVALLAAFLRETDLKVLDHLPAWTDTDPARDRLFDLLLARLEVLAPRKEMVRVVLGDLRRLPGEALRLAPKMIMSMRWIADAAGISTSGLKGAARLRALAAAYASIFPVWLEESDSGMPKTMAALDRRLRRMESLWPQVFGASRRRDAEAAHTDGMQG